jgi:hypothetical protein
MLAGMAPAPPTPYSRHHHPAYIPGDAEQAPPERMAGPARCRDMVPRHPAVQIRIGGRWIPGRIERWRQHEGIPGWVVLVRWGTGIVDWAWYLYSPDTIRQASSE